MKQDRKIVGVWLDYQSAILISTPGHDGEGEYSVVKTINRQEHNTYRDNDYTRKKMKHGENEQYFKEVSSQLTPFSDIHLFGPGKAQEELFNRLVEDKHFEGKSLTIDATGNLTDNQMIAVVRDFFKPLVQH